MSDFYFTQMEDGEEVVFGVLTSTSSSSSSSSVSVMGETVHSAGSGSSQETKYGVTNRRVIVEASGQPGATKTVPNADVRRVYLKREGFAGQDRLVIDELETASGERLEQDLGLFPGQDEALIRETFPAAEVVERQEAEAPKKKKGLLSFLFGD